jgi:hypothetical protein
MRNLIIWVIAVLWGVTVVLSKPIESLSAVGRPAPGVSAYDPPPQNPKKVTVPAGTRILIRMIDSLDSSKQKAGYRFSATLETNLQVDDVVVAPRDTMVYGHLTDASSSGRMSGSSQLTLELTDIVINGTAYPLLTGAYQIKGKGEGGNTAKKILGGAGLGALIGGIAGGGKGAGIGALVGGGAGTAVAASKKGEQLAISSESLLEFRLAQPAPLPVAG